MSTAAPQPCAGDAQGHERTDKLIERAEKTVKELKDSRKQVKKTLEAYNKMMKKNGDDRRSAYEKVTEEKQRCEKRAEEIQKRIHEIEKQATKFFGEWGKNLKDIESEELRERSSQRMEDSHLRLERASVTGKDVKVELDSFLADLGDHLTYLEYDLNATSAKSLEADWDKLDQQASHLFDKMDEATRVIQEYIRSLRP
jgi:DNA repair exonuclease SbcCD ATPase subunit